MFEMEIASAVSELTQAVNRTNTLLEMLTQQIATTGYNIKADVKVVDIPEFMQTINNNCGCGGK